MLRGHPQGGCVHLSLLTLYSPLYSYHSPLLPTPTLTISSTHHSHPTLYSHHSIPISPSPLYSQRSFPTSYSLLHSTLTTLSLLPTPYFSLLSPLPPYFPLYTQILSYLRPALFSPLPILNSLLLNPFLLLLHALHTHHSHSLPPIL